MILTNGDDGGESPLVIVVVIVMEMMVVMIFTAYENVVTMPVIIFSRMVMMFVKLVLSGMDF